MGTVIQTMHKAGTNCFCRIPQNINASKTMQSENVSDPCVGHRLSPNRDWHGARSLVQKLSASHCLPHVCKLFRIPQNACLCEVWTAQPGNSKNLNEIARRPNHLAQAGNSCIAMHWQQHLALRNSWNPPERCPNLPIWSLHFNFIMVLLDSAAHIAWHNLDQLGLSRVSWWTRQGGNQKKRNEYEKPTEQRQELLNYGPQGHRFVREPLLCSLRVESTSHGVWCWCCTVLMWKDGNKTCQNNQENDAALDYVEHPTAS